MKRLVAIGLMVSMLCTSAAWAQLALNSSMALEDDPNDPNEPLTELSWMALEEDPNDPNEPLTEWSLPVLAEEDPNDPNEPLTE